MSLYQYGETLKVPGECMEYNDDNDELVQLLNVTADDIQGMLEILDQGIDWYSNKAGEEDPYNRGTIVA